MSLRDALEEALGKVGVGLVAVPKWLITGATVATIDLAQVLLNAVGMGYIVDLSMLRDVLAAALTAEKQKVLASAAQASNKATDVKAQTALKRAQAKREAAAAEREKAEAAKFQAEAVAAVKDAESRRIDAEARRAEAVGNATANLINAVSSLQQAGGGFAINSDMLSGLLSGQFVVPVQEDEPPEPEEDEEAA